jgi:hypothetical protein
VIDLATMTIAANIDKGPATGHNYLRHATSVAISGHYAYVTAFYDSRVTVIDISNRANPVVAASLNNSNMLGGAYRIRVRGDFAYVSASSAHAVAAIDISDPTAPRLAGSLIDSAHLNQTTGLDLDSSGRYLIASSPRSATPYQRSNASSTAACRDRVAPRRLRTTPPSVPGATRSPCRRPTPPARHPPLPTPGRSRQQPGRRR